MISSIPRVLFKPLVLKSAPGQSESSKESPQDLGLDHLTNLTQPLFKRPISSIFSETND
jgi:hypothetical protein